MTGARSSLINAPAITHGAAESSASTDLPAKSAFGPSNRSTGSSSFVSQSARSALAPGHGEHVEQQPPPQKHEEMGDYGDSQKPKTLRVGWLAASMHENAIVRSRGTNCSLKEFRMWAERDFQMARAKEELQDVLVCSGDDLDGQEASDETIWTQLLSGATTERGTKPIIVQCLSNAMPAAKGQRLATQPI
ncbi:hypothetical protein NX059_006883 [Plenodomus lindquistii]|nr:hypothetical protein NX059_006883 [Plenodomus lindquistii]